jgi:hypothetical protein
MRYLKTLIVIVAMAFLALGALGCGRVARSAARGAGKSLSGPIGHRSSSVLRRDLARDRLTAAKPLRKSTKVFRYTSAARARKEAASGIKKGSHFTARAGRGRPLSSKKAMRRYGLPKRPQARETVILPKGAPVRRNKVLGGEPGIGEISTAKRVPAGAVKKVVRVP